MSSNVDSKEHHSARKLGNIFLSWKIHHYTLTSAKSNCRIVSPIFDVRGPERTTWQLIILPYLEVNAKKHFVFQLHRLDNESAATVVWTDWKIALMSIEEYCLCSKVGNTFFKGKSWYGTTVSEDASGIFRKLNTFKSDTLLLYFQLIVNNSVNNSFEATSDIGLKSLSRDLLALYKSGKFSDVRIRIRDKSIKAHKAILHCRSPHFKDFIQQYQDEDVLDIREFPFQTVYDMLSYLYSGKLEFVLGKPSISMYECAIRFRIEEVKRYYCLDYFELESRIGVGEMHVVWYIRNYKTRMEPCIRSQLFTEPLSTVTFSLSLYPKGENGRNCFISLLGKFVSGDKKPKRICLQLGFIDCKGKLVNVSKITAAVENNAVLELCHWPYTVINSNVLVKGTLRIDFKLQVCEFEGSWESFGTPCLNPFSNPNDIEHSYSRLSKDIMSLLTSGIYSDVTFASKCMDFNVHKCILAERSRTFYNQITGCVHLSCRKSNLKSHIISILMDFLYSGILRNCNFSNISEIYDVADEFLLPSLKVTASRFLQTNLTVENVTDFLIFADRKNDAELKLSALKFICLNSPAVFEQKNFKQLKTSHVFLCTEAHEFARNDYYAFTSVETPQILPNSNYFRTSRSPT